MTRWVTAREYAGGVIAVDGGMFGRERVACYVVEAADQVALIEVGGNSSASRILSVIERRGWGREHVSHVIVTHVHLDHAGGAGRLMQLLPNAMLVVHPRGARHMIDPSQLEAGTRAVYGDAVFDAVYGHLIPVPRARVITMEDGDTLAIGRRELLFRHTPGHAKHHFCVWDGQTRGWFTGDTLGVSYRDTDTPAGPFIFPTTTPIQFDPEALISSIEGLLAIAPDYLYLTHYGRVGDPGRLAAQMIAGVRKLVEIAERNQGSANRRADIEAETLDWLYAGCRAHGVSLSHEQLADLLEADVKLNTQGVEYWLDHRDPVQGVSSPVVPESSY
jgi:glyoxylase-like metal-dependent hydrolase (beta-lactamase superfamily II)